MNDLATIPAKIVRVLDVETSGLPEDEERAIVEFGWVDLDLETLTFSGATSHLVNPGHSIPPHIRAIHHISNTMVADAISPADACTLAMKGLLEADVLCAHRASFEQAFFGGGNHRWVCTWKCAMRAWQDAQSYGNQALRYLLDIDAEADFDPAAAFPPHRALPDAIVTGFILRRLLRLRPLERLIEISAEPPLSVLINFGKHKGSKWAEVPADYLRWLIDKSDMDDEVKGQARYWLARRRPLSPAGATIPADGQTPATDDATGRNEALAE